MECTGVDLQQHKKHMTVQLQHYLKLLTKYVEVMKFDKIILISYNTFMAFEYINLYLILVRKHIVNKKVCYWK